jgi:hypothetical protein
VEEHKHLQLVEVMARMAEGDRAAVFTLYAEFGPAIAAVMRRELARLGRYGVDADDLDGLVIDACLELARLARAWDPDRGAAPWTWAMRRLTRLASDFVGIHADPLDEGVIHSMVWPADLGGGGGCWRPGTRLVACCWRRSSRSALLATVTSCSRCGCKPAWATRRRR